MRTCPPRPPRFWGSKTRLSVSRRGRAGARRADCRPWRPTSQPLRDTRIDCVTDQTHIYIHTFSTVHTYIHTYIHAKIYKPIPATMEQAFKSYSTQCLRNKTHTSKGHQHLFPFQWHAMAWRPRHRSATHDVRNASIYFSYLHYLPTLTLIIYSPILLVPYIHTMYVCIGGQRISPVFGNGHESLVDVLQPESDSDNRPCVRGGPTLHGDRLG